MNCLLTFSDFWDDAVFILATSPRGSESSSDVKHFGTRYKFSERVWNAVERFVIPKNGASFRQPFICSLGASPKSQQKSEKV